MLATRYSMPTTFRMLFHRDLGGAGRPPLVIVHGFLGSSRNWQTAGAGLAAGFQVLETDGGSSLSSLVFNPAAPPASP